MKERIKTLLIGMLIGGVLVPTTYATVGTITKELSYNNIKITLNGSEVTPTDASGNYVEPFIIDGTTYLPVRGIASALDLGVEWNGETNTVMLSHDKTSDAPSAGEITQKGDIIYNMDGVKITLADIQMENSGNSYRFLIENSTDNVVMFYGGDISANDFMIYDYISANLQPHKKAEMHLYIDKGKYSNPHIDEVETIEIEASCSFHEEGTLHQVKENKSTIKLSF
ncbi:MAG: hypothetical protein E7413_01065 [Ruminococcaceae bacterium]|nr:hypothetical protein [Oscillospiraceae bacterium]